MVLLGEILWPAARYFDISRAILQIRVCPTRQQYQRVRGREVVETRNSFRVMFSCRKNSLDNNSNPIFNVERIFLDKDEHIYNTTISENSDVPRVEPFDARKQMRHSRVVGHCGIHVESVTVNPT